MIEDMRQGDPGRKILRFALPSLLSGMLEIVYTLSDSVVVSQLVGLEAFAAIGASSFAYWLVFCIVSGIASGFSSYFAKAYGAKEHDRLREAIVASLWLVLLIGTALSIGGALAAKPILVLLDTPDTILPDASRYLQIRMACLGIAFALQTVHALYYALGNSRVPFLAGFLSGVLNIILTVLALLFTPLGVRAVAITTAISQVFALCFGVIRLRSVWLLQSQSRWMRPNGKTAKEMLAIGLPLGMRDFLSAVIALFVQHGINQFGMAHVAGVAAAKQLYSLLFSVAFALSGALAAFVGQNFGAKNGQRIVQGKRWTRRAMLISVAVLVSITLLFKRPLLRMFIPVDHSEAAKAMEVGLRQLYLIVLFLPAYYMALLYQACLRGIGDGFWSMVSGLVEAATRLVVLFGFVSTLGEWGLYLVEVAGWPMMAIQLCLSFRRSFRKSLR